MANTQAKHGESGIIRVDLSDIDAELRPASQMRLALSDEAIAAYAEDLDSLPPVRLVYDKVERVHWLADGCHTVHAAKLKRKTTVKAIVQAGSYIDAFQIGSKANDVHGVRVTNADKRHRIEVALSHSEMKEWTNRMIADVCGVTHPFVSEIRRIGSELETVSNSEPATRTGKDGKQYPVKRKKRKDGSTSDGGTRKAKAATTTPPEPEPAPPPTPTAADTSKQVINGLFVANGNGQAAPAPTVQAAPQAPTIGPRTWHEEWEREEALIIEHYESWPAAGRPTFAIRLLAFAGRFMKTRHPEIEDLSDRPLI